MPIFSDSYRKFKLNEPMIFSVPTFTETAAAMAAFHRRAELPEYAESG
jgi:hypothetical protein